MFIFSDKDHVASDMTYNRHIVKGLVYEGDFLYFVKYQKYYFLTLLGGAVDNDESPSEAFYREVLEESGIVCHIEKELPQILEVRQEQDFNQLTTAYVAQYLSQERAQLEAKELSDGLTLERIHVKDAIKIMLEQKCETRQQCFLNSRDVSILSAFVANWKILQNGLYDISEC